jgi:hypothetical protein
MATHSKPYWFIVNSLKGTRAYAGRHKLAFGSIAFAILFILYVLRSLIQSSVLFARIYSFDIALAAVALYGIEQYRHRMKWRSWLAVLVVASLVFWSFSSAWNPHQYLSLYIRYRSLDKEMPALMPETDHERIQPLNSIRVMANQIMTNNLQPSEPFNVRVDGDYRWTMAIEPSYFWSRVFGGVQGIINVSATAPAPNFSEESRSVVQFSVGDNMLLGKNSKVCTVRSFGISRFLSYEPADARYLKDDNGEWVEVVSLIHWQGFFFPQPVFGGVQVIRQSKGGALHFLKMLLIGDGEWIPPENIDEHPFLKGQNIVPYAVSRFIAESFRFHRGFLAPFWGYHQGDVCIPDLPDDLNDQPFNTFFRFDTGEAGLYHYFCLEPYQQNKRGASISLIVPADGVGPVRVYDHDLRKETMIGVSAVAAQVKASKKMYDWTHSRPTEHRPYIRTIDGKRRFFWLTTIVTKGNTNSYETGEYIAGSTPDVTLTDPLYQMVVWVDSRHPETWPAELEKELGTVWKSG